MDTISETNEVHLFSSATKTPVTINGVIMLQIQLADLRTWEWFGIVYSVEFTMILVTDFIDMIIKGIFPKYRNIVPNNASWWP